MSYLALVTDQFDAVADFYGRVLGFSVVVDWDRPNGRGRRFDLGQGLRLELLDNRRERIPVSLAPPGDRIQIVVEVDRIREVHLRMGPETPEPRKVSWGAWVFQMVDPDGVAVTFLEWDPPSATTHPNVPG